MTLINCYCTLEDVKARLMATSLRTAATLSFTSGTKTISDSASGLRHFQAGDYIQVSGSVSNDGFYTVVAGNNPAFLTVSETVVTEAAGATVTLKSVIDQKDDSGLESVITAVCRAIDSVKGRRFYTVNETRIYAPAYATMIEIDDLVGLTTLKTDPNNDGSFSTTWGPGDYRLAPYNAALDGRPYEWIETTAAGVYRFPISWGGYNILINSDYPRPANPPPRVQITGAFGYSTTAPAPIKEWAILAAMRVWGRKDKVHEVSGSAELGTLEIVTAMQKDGELNLLLSTIKRRARV